MSEQSRTVPGIPGYRTGRLLGFGSSGEVWSAVAEDGEDVALKVLRPVSDAREGTGRDLDTVLRETTVLRRLDHEHIVRLRTVDQAPGFGPVLVMDRAHGGSLGALVGARGALDVGEVVTVLSPLAAALADLHEMGLVHGDVAPGNVLFDGRGRPLLSDLGLATIVGEPAPGEVHGTPGYADPARLDGAPPSPASDVHGLAAVGWLALTGRPPQPAGERPPLATLASDAPADLTDVLEAALDADPGARPTARELAVRCFDAAPAEPVRLVPTDPGAAAAEVVTHRLRAAAAAPAGATVPARPARRARHRCSPETGRRPWVLSGLAGVAAIVVVAAGAVAVPRLLDGGDAAPPSTASASSPREQTASFTVPAAVDQALRGDDPVAAVPVLAWLRARAFATGDAVPLQRADAAGGPALAEDLEHLRALASRGVVLEGLGFDVRSVEVTSRDGDTAIVEAAVVTLAHRQVDGDGTVLAAVPAGQERRSRLTLKKAGEGWQVFEVLR